MVAVSQLANQDHVEVAQAEAPKLKHVIWYKDPGLRKLYFYGIILCFSCATTGYDGSMLNGLQILPVWQSYFNHPSGPLLGVFGSIYSIGNLCGLPVVVFVADTYGRKMAITAGIFMLAVAVAVQGAAINFPMFIAARFFVGFGCSLAQGSAPLLVTELCHPQHRARFTSAYNIFWNLGAIIATWLTFGTFTLNNSWSWRIPSIFQAFCPLVVLVFLYWIPESPRWLVSKDRDREALAILAKYHANGDETDSTVQFEFLEIRETLRLEYQGNKTSSYLDFVRTKGNRYRLLLVVALGLFSQWSGNGLTSYYFSIVMNGIGITDADTQFKINGCSTIASLVIGLIAASLVDKIGRRPIFLFATVGMVGCFAIWTACSALYTKDKDFAAGKATVAFIFIHSAFYHVAWSGLLVAYTVEIMPYKLRAKGLMAMNFFVQAALIFNQYINPIGLANLTPRWKFYTIYCVWLLFELVFVYFLFPETKGPTLEEIAKIFDGDDAEVAHIDADNLDILDRKMSIIQVEDVTDTKRAV